MGTVRFLLAMCVVATHYPGGSIFGIVPLPGPTAVQAFYVISGFLITMVLSERADYTNVRKFYISRYLRLWPVYATVASIQLYLVWPQYLIKLAENNLTAAYLVFTNLVIFGQDLALFLRFDEGGGLAFTSSFASWPGPQVNNYLLVPQAWSLGIELAFYVIAPFFCRRDRKSVV